ncbi:NAD-dependent epimerase/dehydratase family protein [bacterium]|jgi:UDP-glucuronate 4-epimerase|nr:NAD-dependent epimerase/dehydratase family protein [bacterium]
MKYLVTGCAGFIGSHVSQRLLNEGHQVVGVDNLNNYYDTRIKGDNVAELLVNDNFVFYKIDITNFTKLTDIFDKEGIDKIIHLAARAGVRHSIEDPRLYTLANVNGTVNLLELAQLYNVKNFVFASSSSVYGERNDVPFHEDDEIKPISPYAATKKAGELLGYTYHTLYGFNFTALRFFNVYGPKARPDQATYKFIKAMMNNDTITVYGDGSSLRDYTFVHDIVRGILSAADKDLGYEVINLGGSSPVKLMDFIKTFEKVIGKQAKRQHIGEQAGDVSKTYADTAKAKRLLDWETKTNLEQGLTETYKYFKEKNNWY